ncbi:MAG: hypothetical protein K940chlam8_00506 [Chlamydiae bacterium]|nr:hypothetical protein [Chlamydiota bacterium]
MRILALLCLLFPLFSQPTQDSQQDTPSTQILQGAIQFVNTENTSVMVLYKGMSDEFFILPQTKMTSNNQQISLQNLQAGQKVKIEFDSTNSRNELVSLDVTSPIVQNPIKPKTNTVSIFGYVTGIEPFSRLLIINSKSRLYNLTVSNATKITKGGKSAQFMDLEIGQKVKITAQQQNQQLYPISIDIE